MLEAVSRRAFQIATGLVLLFATLTPLANAFDTWDKNPAPANDTEMHVAAWFAGAGFVLAMSKLLRLIARPMRGAFHGRRAALVLVSDRADERPEPTPTGSPPLLPLRI